MPHCFYEEGGSDEHGLQHTHTLIKTKQEPLNDTQKHRPHVIMDEIAPPYHPLLNQQIRFTKPHKVHIALQ